ncbi:hypothetical protein [Mycobacteroides abscessus]|uniref:hypothetical protein n=1 Tax=Mycobacteroides abscessus TaxID=36809 RepID=UPI001F37AD33|nr:hypothetical protein [Mycobacteroides abscessus]
MNRIRAIAYLAEVPETVAFVAAGARAPMAERYEPPAEAQRMTTSQRKALDQPLRVFLGDQASVKYTGEVAFLALLAVREQLNTATSTGDRQALTEAARSAIRAIDEVAAAVFAMACNDDGGHTDDSPTASHQPWPPVEPAALIGVAP